MRRILKTLAIASALVSFAFAALWLRSLWRSDEIAWRVREYCVQGIGTRNGAVYYFDERGPEAQERHISSIRWNVSSPYAGRLWKPHPFSLECWGEGYDVIDSDIPRDDWYSYKRIHLTADWFLIAVFLIPPLLVYAVRARLARRISPGHCRVCRYDLRASINRCPECGTPFSAHAPLFPSSLTTDH